MLPTSLRGQRAAMYGWSRYVTTKTRAPGIRAAAKRLRSTCSSYIVFRAPEAVQQAHGADQPVNSKARRFAPRIDILPAGSSCAETLGGPSEIARRVITSRHELPLRSR